VTHLIEAGYDPAFVQTQVAHAYASTTGLYTSAGSTSPAATAEGYSRYSNAGVTSSSHSSVSARVGICWGRVKPGMK
jgi:hypothetical protein